MTQFLAALKHIQRRSLDSCVDFPVDLVQTNSMDVSKFGSQQFLTVFHSGSVWGSW